MHTTSFTGCGTILVAGLFTALNVLFIYAVPLEQMKGAVGAFAATDLSVRPSRDFSALP